MNPVLEPVSYPGKKKKLLEPPSSVVTVRVLNKTGSQRNPTCTH